MKTRMIAMLEENDKHVFESDERCFYLKASVEDGVLVLRELDGKPSNIVCLYLDRDWQLARQPVTWQEALQAWLDGKDIEIRECAGCSNGENCLGLRETTIRAGGLTSLSACRQQFKTAKWYIND